MTSQAFLCISFLLHSFVWSICLDEISSILCAETFFLSNLVTENAVVSIFGDFKYFMTLSRCWDIVVECCLLRPIDWRPAPKKRKNGRPTKKKTLLWRPLLFLMRSCCLFTVNYLWIIFYFYSVLFRLKIIWCVNQLNF